MPHKRLLQVYILTIRDQSDFGRVMHESAHPDESSAWKYSTDAAMPDVRARVDAEWHDALEARVRALDFYR